MFADIMKNGVDKLLWEINEKFNLILSENKRLANENIAIKSEIYKDEEIKRLKSKIDELNKRKIGLMSPQGEERFKSFTEQHLLKCPSGQEYHFEIYPTSLGNVIYCVCGCGDKKNIEDI